MIVCDMEHLTGLGSAWLEYSHSSDEYGSWDWGMAQWRELHFIFLTLLPEK